ncbi:MAG: hypothetical protein PHR83_15910 [Paludibacter sp.]|nr:hypothetical protein [Paludibacter sp.]
MEKNQFQGKVTGKEILPEFIDELSKDFTSEFYWVVFTGYAQNLKEYHVQINNCSRNEGYSSDWPESFYLLAKEAMLYNRRLLVISKGVPFGSNIEQVLIMHENG